jgi:hypothetical protein
MSILVINDYKNSALPGLIAKKADAQIIGVRQKIPDSIQNLCEHLMETQYCAVVTPESADWSNPRVIDTIRAQHLGPVLSFGLGMSGVNLYDLHFKTTSSNFRNDLYNAMEEINQ